MRGRFDLTAPVPPATDLGPVHFLGIGGIGMSAIARIMAGRGIPVSGSDGKDTPVLSALRALGVDARVGFDPARLTGVGAVVASSAIREDNPELAAARTAGLPVLHRSQALQSLMLGRRGVAVAGTSGKTTTTSMLTVLLREAGLDPSFAIGGELVGAATNGRDGTGDIFVAEADESDASFLVYTTEVSVVTNVQPDHLDFYGTPDRVVEAFEAFSDRLVVEGRDGLLVACGDDPGSAALAARAEGLGRRVVTYGTTPGVDVRADQIVLHPAGSHFVLRADDDPAPVALVVPGEHNVLNALAAYAAARAFEVPPAAARAGLGAFTGTRRRFEFRGEAAGVRVYDDYAHNPAKVAAAVATGRQVAGAGRLVVVFQPHLYSRTRDFAEQFGRALSGADEVVLMDVYAAREDPLPGVDGALVAGHVDLPPARVHDEPAWEQAAPTLAALAGAGDVIVTIGAGDVTEVAGHVLDLLRRRGRG